MLPIRSIPLLTSCNIPWGMGDRGILIYQITLSPTQQWDRHSNGEYYTREDCLQSTQTHTEQDLNNKTLLYRPWVTAFLASVIHLPSTEGWADSNQTLKQSGLPKILKGKLNLPAGFICLSLCSAMLALGGCGGGNLRGKPPPHRFQLSPLCSAARLAPEEEKETCLERWSPLQKSVSCVHRAQLPSPSVRALSPCD